jgi:hypothetical protein
MDTILRKDLARAYIERRQTERRTADRSPLHGIDEIRRELDWDYSGSREADRRDAERRNR